MKPFIGVLLLVVAMVRISYSQPVGRFYSGIASSTNENISVTPSKKYLTGYFFGLGGTITNSTVSPYFGIQYHKRNINPTTHFFLPEEGEKVEFLKFRFGANARLFRIRKLGGVHIRGLVATNSVLSLNQKKSLALGHGPLKENAVSWVAGIGIHFNVLTIDFEYEKHISNSYPEIGDSRFTVLNLSLGFHF